MPSFDLARKRFKRTRRTRCALHWRFRFDIMIINTFLRDIYFQNALTRSSPPIISRLPRACVRRPTLRLLVSTRPKNNKNAPNFQCRELLWIGNCNIIENFYGSREKYEVRFRDGVTVNTTPFVLNGFRPRVVGRIYNGDKAEDKKTNRRNDRLDQISTLALGHSSHSVQKLLK